MSRRDKTIVGTRFQCTMCSGKGSYFIASQGAKVSNFKAMNALRERVKQHWADTGHDMILPVNPPKGFYYVNTRTGKQVGATYCGKDLSGWLVDIKALLRGTCSEPSWELKL